MKDDLYYQMVAKFYEGKFAKRSGVPYMNHIDEGMVLCDHLGYDLYVKRAFCLHPLFQADEALAGIKQWERVADTIFVDEFDAYVMMLVMEYRNKANGYLSNKDKKVEDISLSPLEQVNQMLVVDKVQNRKDFEKYHFGSHPRSFQLNTYFHNWLQRLGISEDKYQELKALID